MIALDTAALWQNLQDGGRRDFLVTPDERISYAQLAEAIGRWLAWFRAAGLEPGDRIVIRTANEPLAITGFLAAFLDGVVPVLLTPDTPDLRLVAVTEFVDAVAVAGDGASPPKGLSEQVQLFELHQPQAARKRGLFNRKTVSDPFAALPAAASITPRLPRDAEGLAYILFTSGTTSSPSGVQISRGNLFANLTTSIRVFEYDHRSRIFNDMILAHADGMIQGPVMALAAGCAVIRAGGFQLATIEPWLERVRAERATHVITVPTVWSMIDRYAAHTDYFDAPECGRLLSVAAKLPDDLWRRLEEKFVRPVFNQYGLTETVVTALWAGPHPEMGGFGTIGKPIDCEARIDPTIAGEDGELQLRGANIFPGYWRDEARTHASFTADGWLKTGDLARHRPDGSYEIIGRLKSMIMMGGFLIRPDEIDEQMMRCPAVAESATVAMEDETFGEVPVTAVVLATDADEASLTEHARSVLEGRKVPKRIIALASIPRGDAGKPKIKELREMIAPMLAGAPVAGLADEDLDAAVMALAAEVFRVDLGQLTSGTRAGDIPGWDSFSQLNFVLAAEQRFGVTIPASRVATIESIDDMARSIRDLRA